MLDTFSEPNLTFECKGLIIEKSRSRDKRYIEEVTVLVRIQPINRVTRVHRRVPNQRRITTILNFLVGSVKDSFSVHELCDQTKTKIISIRSERYSALNETNNR